MMVEVIGRDVVIIVLRGVIYRRTYQEAGGARQAKGRIERRVKRALARGKTPLPTIIRWYRGIHGGPAAGRKGEMG